MVLKTSQLCYQAGNKTLLTGIDLTLHPGDFYGILGLNGAGKTTLLKLLTAIWRPTSGCVEWEGNNLQTYSRLQIGRLLSLVPQHTLSPFPLLAVDLVRMGLYASGICHAEAEERVQSALMQVNSWEMRHRFISTLSAGERQRMYIARSLASPSHVHLLDEPVACLDLPHRKGLWRLLRGVADSGKCVIATLHDFREALPYLDTLIFLHQGRCVGVTHPGSSEAVHLLHTLFDDLQK